MKHLRANSVTMSALGGLYLILLYCALATGADAITRIVAQGFNAPQLFCFSGGIVAALSLFSNRMSPARGTLKTTRPIGMAIRSVLFILSSLFYFYAFRSLPFAEVFVFIALVPIFAALLSGPILGEPVRWQSWLALIAGFAGMVMLYPDGIGALSFPHLSAALGAMAGACSMVMARHISRDDRNALLQVLYPNLAMFALMAVALPFVYKQMTPTDMVMIASYASLLFLARWVLILALSRIKAHVVTLLLNLQFVVMVLAGIVLFDETPEPNLIAGAAVIILAGAYVFLEQIIADAQKKIATSRRRKPRGTGAMALTLRS